MTKKPRSAKQLANDRRLAELAKARRENTKAEEVPPPVTDLPEHPDPDVSQEQSTDELRRQVEEMKEMMTLMRQAMTNQSQPQGVQLGRTGQVIGEIDKYLVDPANYPDPTSRLSKEPRLAPLAFEHNYELTYEVSTSSYETKTGQHFREPKFNITLLRVVTDEQGNRVKVTDPKTGKLQDKFYIARKLVFHEDPQAAMTIARENGLEIDGSDEKRFLDEMRYLRVRDWLFDIFWPGQAQKMENMQDEVIGGQIVQVFTRNSEESGSIPFDKMTTKFRA